MLERPEADEGGPSPDAPERFEDFFVREYARVLAVATGLSANRWAAVYLTQAGFLAAHADW